jgi:HKD family nuclease
MSVEVVPHALGIEGWLHTAIERNLDCLFTVAYLSDAGVKAIEAAIRERMQRPRFSLRVLFQDDDLVTEPDALDRLRRCARGSAGTITLKYAADPNFHAKAFGFRSSRSARSASVIVGSANLTNKAIGIDSGELDVSVSPSKVGSELWATMVEFWNEGEEIDGPWLKAYRRAYERKKAALEAAEKVRRGWSRRKRRGETERAVSATQPLWIEHVAPEKPEVFRAARRGRDAALKNGIEIPGEFVIYRDRRSASEVPTRQDVLEIRWRSDDADDGLSSMRVIHSPGAVRVTDPRSKLKFWMVPRKAIRGSTLTVRKKDGALIKRLLAQSGRTLRWLDESYGKPRAQRWAIVFALLRALRSARRPTRNHK